MDTNSRPDGNAESAPSRAAQVSRDTGRIIDWNRAREATAHDEGLLAEVIEAFREEAPLLQANIRQAIADRDAVILHRAAHTIKNAFYSLGAQTTGDLAFELEKAGEKGDFQRATQLCQSLESELRAVSQELDNYMKNRGAST